MKAALTIIIALLAGTAIAQTPANRWEKMGIQPINTPSQPSVAAPAPDPAKTKRDDNTQRAYALARLLKENANDPRSFELVNAVVTERGAVCIRFRARNAFNAIMTQDIAVTHQNKESTRAVACAAKEKPRDVTGIKYML